MVEHCYGVSCEQLLEGLSTFLAVMTPNEVRSATGYRPIGTSKERGDIVGWIDDDQTIQTNCKNCGAPLSYQHGPCAYCGTRK